VISPSAIGTGRRPPGTRVLALREIMASDMPAKLHHQGSSGRHPGPSSERLHDVGVLELRAQPRLVREHADELGVIGQVVDAGT
jgi:hypothetical protein